ncbi:MAG: MFS transporter [Planctomycetaceae bacterium]
MKPAKPTSMSMAWLVVAFLMPVALLNYLDRQMLASMKQSVMQSIPTIKSDANWGFMLGQFKWVYAFLSPIGGLVADRFGRRLTICGSLFVWSAVTLWTGYVATFNELLLARSLMGISEAFYIPAALALIADYHTGSTRSRAVGLHQMAIYLGVIVGGLGGYIAENPDYGWQFAFISCGLIGMVYAIPLAMFIEDVPLNKSKSTVPRTSLLRDISDLLTNGSFILLVLYFTLPALAGWVVRDWMPAILKAQFQVGQGQAGFAATFYWQVAAIFGAFLGGWLADRAMASTPRGRIYISAIGMALIVPAIFGVGNASSLMMAIWFLILFGIGWGFFDCNNMPILSQIVRPNLRATGYGLMNLVSISCGGLADWGFGSLRDRNVPINIIFSVFASAAILSVVLVLLIRPRPELSTPESSS